MRSLSRLYTITAFALMTLTFSLWAAPMALADTMKLPPGSEALIPLEKPDHVQFEPLCPKGVTCVTDGTIVTLTYLLAGCLDSLAPVQFQFTQGQGAEAHTLLVSAMAIQNERSPFLRCPTPTARKVKLAFPGVFGDIQITPLTNSVLPE